MKIPTWLAILVAIAAIVSVREIFQNQRLKSKVKALEAGLILRIDQKEQSLKGYPAPESELAEGKYYWADAMMADQWPDHVECFLVLQEAVSDGEHWMIAPGEKRLFRTDIQVVKGVVYQVTRTNGVVTLKKMDRVPPALPTFRGLKAGTGNPA